MPTPKSATIDDLYRVDGNAELVNGKIVHGLPVGRMPAYAIGEIAFSLHRHIRTARLPGISLPGNTAYRVRLPNRESFSPDAAYYEGPNSGMRFFEGAPQFAVEARSENDYGVVAEQEREDKRADYFAAGTLVVWDVDLRGEAVVRKYATPDFQTPVAVFRRGEIADAEPAVPGWTMPVNDLFENP